MRGQDKKISEVTLISCLLVLLVYTMLASQWMQVDDMKTKTVNAASISEQIVTQSLNRTSVSVTVDYLEEMATVTAGSGGSTKFYLSTDKKNWELLSGAVFDISMLLKAKDITVYLKGNRDQAICSLILQGEETNLKAKYTIVSGEGQIQVTGASGTIEYRKGSKGNWKTYTGPIFTAPYEVKGCTFQFREAASKEKRAKKIVSVKIAKRTNAPNVKIDGNKLCITGIKETMEYRVGDNETWKSFTNAQLEKKYIELRELVAPGTNMNTAIVAGSIEVRTKATDKKVASGAKLISFAAQPGEPSTASLSGTTLTISNASRDIRYEYAVVAKTAISLDLYTMKWVAVTKNTPVVLKNVSVGDRILVRLKSTTERDTQMVTPASVFKEFIVTTITTK